LSKQTPHKDHVFLGPVLCISQVFLVLNIIVNLPNRCQVDLKVPVVVRLEGTNVDQGKRILKVRAVDISGACLMLLLVFP
jgi:succinyl-CoA synthetase beta subunit